MVARPGSFVMLQSSPLPALCSFPTAVHCWRWKSFVRPRAVGHIVGSALRPSGPTGWEVSWERRRRRSGQLPGSLLCLFTQAARRVVERLSNLIPKTSND
ncbi:hypothetical protein ACOMHN_053630 [Nucella lapillus]